MRDQIKNSTTNSTRYSIDKNIQTWLRQKLKKGSNPCDITSERSLTSKATHLQSVPFRSRRIRSFSNSRNPSAKDHILHEDDEQSILHLPKLPFGVHCSYNSEKDFVSSHFVNGNDETVPLQTRQEIEDKLRYIKKKKILAKKRHLSQPFDDNQVRSLSFSSHQVHFVPDEWQVYIQPKLPRGLENDIYQTNRVLGLERLQEKKFQQKLHKFRGQKLDISRQSKRVLSSQENLPSPIVLAY